jgi:hypothetical protein
MLSATPPMNSMAFSSMPSQPVASSRLRSAEATIIAPM